MQKLLIFLGLAFLIVGVLWPFFGKIGLGRLPGDILVERDGGAFYFPIVTCLVVSAVLSVLFWLFGR
ncbi:MAG: DUF2905 domain-containing protein [Pseudomonadota bacterium]